MIPGDCGVVLRDRRTVMLLNDFPMVGRDILIFLLVLKLSLVALVHCGKIECISPGMYATRLQKTHGRHREKPKHLGSPLPTSTSAIFSLSRGTSALWMSSSFIVDCFGLGLQIPKLRRYVVGVFLGA